ncbi:bifunctional 23S rRNA (guanine(2069)-N(7))-methyltransferase RlmK/23S rRNA (guanine(2445)-N(2))-methyltransferase RlmL [Bythopirellula goksoeyrii]|uniref:Ribosomal RNA large subunit methyltransferase K/L n=1 Tax=Bythopirellula goksoeyrii TaxID=1400387 RepID=A0A5B9Q9Z1_9BACT|nr:bifunctional 23S rRNA (guanine(2069)-N(7))-methyltransferase RlmK/23S rRNA (guanine(2445)-N(2))-methyltransferase RlmL [Bythopirellula goksoeyrii]QEG34579.1 Ribosomal RNA large subunit methyltransferase K/L [Bythopirellula goksoeyrii]
MSFQLVATAAFGLEAVVVRELATLGYEGRVARPGRIEFDGDEAAICRSNLWLRSADRILLQLAKFSSPDFDALFDTATELSWEEWIHVEAAILVRGRSHKSQLSSVPAVQRTVKKAIVQRLLNQFPELPETGPPVPVEIAILDDEATLSIDTSGEGLHKRGYRKLAGPAQLRETLAAALVQLSFWKPERPLVDPFCGTGTIIIEAAMLARRMAPGRNRVFAAEQWPTFPGEPWRIAREEAADLILPNLEERPMGTDIDSETLSLARYHAEQAEVAEDVHFQQRAFADLTSKRQFGCTIMNPPYGLRMGEEREVAELYRTFPEVLRGLKSWSHYILSAREDLEQLVGQEADRRRKLYNGKIACTYYQFYGPRPPKDSQYTQPAEAPAFGGLRDEARRQAEEFANRLKKLARHLRRWPTKRGITCYRLYERDIPEVPLVVDRYEDALHLAEIERPHERTAAEHADWLDLMCRTAAEALDVPREAVFLKHRARQRGTSQYERVSDRQEILTVTEGGLKFKVNLSDYLDTGLFLDHRITREMVRKTAAGKRFLNLFCYTGAFTVYAAVGGAASTTSVDLSANYLDWAVENLQLNGLAGPQHRFIRADAEEFLSDLKPDEKFDLAVVDPPTFSNSKRLEHDWDVQLGHVPLLNKLIEHMAPEGVIYFSTNSRRFKLDEAALKGVAIREISKQTVPEDFRNKRIHRCWRLVAR